MSRIEYPEPLLELTELLRLLPGVGRRGAERLALALYKWEPDKLEGLGMLLRELPATVGPCPECGAIARANELCAVCLQPNRDRGVLCVIEESPQLFAIERSGQFRGLYHVLGGRLSPLENRTAETLNIPRLVARVERGEVQEVILALGADVEGRATAVYLSEILRPYPVKISRPAIGLPAGSSLTFADAATIGMAFSARTEL